MNDEGFVPGIIFGAIAGVFVASLCWGMYSNELKAKAVKLNAAEWLVNPDNGETTFTWKESK